MEEREHGHGLQKEMDRLEGIRTRRGINIDRYTLIGH